jgi:hypothetical protein
LWTILEGLSIASGKQITHDPVRQDGAVWIYNTEDPYDELERRIVAAARYHKLTRADTQRLYYTSGYDKPLTFAKYDEGNRPGLNEGLIGHMIGFIREKAIRLLIIDPFVECHQVKENDNDAINLVMQGFRRIALETGCALGLVHHSSKGTDANSRGNADKARGASALVSAARVAHTLYPMTSKEGKDYLLPAGDHRWYVRVDNAKSNLAPPTERYTWYKKQSVQLLFDADEDPTGTLEPVVLDAVTNSGKVDVGSLAAALLEPGESRSIHQLATILVDSGRLEGALNTVKNKIEGAFLRSQTYGDRRYTLTTTLNLWRNVMSVQYSDGSFSETMPFDEAVEEFQKALDLNTARALIVGTEDEIEQIKNRKALEDAPEVSETIIRGRIPNRQNNKEKSYEY